MTILYKFVSSREAVIAMARGSLKFTKIDELNDPSELVPLMNREAVRNSLAAIRTHGYDDRQFGWLGHQEAVLRLLSPETRILSRPATLELANRTLAMTVYDNLDFMEEQVLRTITLIRSRVGVLSLTERFDSLPMWAHYGTQGKGYALQFKGLGQEFCGDETGSLNALKPVSYVEDFVGLTHDPSTQDNLFFCKLQDWKYEREWRVVSALSACKLNSNNVPLRSVYPAYVSGVIVGWNVPASETACLALELRQINPTFQVRTAQLERGRVVLTDARI